MGNNFLENFAYIMMKMAKFFIKLAIFCIIIYYIGMKLFTFGHRLFYEKAMEEGDGKEIIFEIKNGDTSDIIANNLYDLGLIDDKLSFVFRSKIYKTKLTPNVYNLNTNMTIKNMLDIFDTQQKEHIVTNPSNESIYQLSSEEDDENLESTE